MQQQGYKVKNTNGEDLDEDQSSLTDSKAEVVTAFEILEHLLSPYQVLKSIKAKKLVVSVPCGCGFLLIEVKKISGIDIITNLRIGNSIGF